MKTLTGPKKGSHCHVGFRTLTAVALIFAAAIQPSFADIPDRQPIALSGMYRIAASNDPLFPMGSKQEWFLDFGTGTLDGTTSGKVAVSLRENPNVSVRIMVWQYFPRDNALMIGNQTAEGSARALVRGGWTLSSDSGAIFLLRENATIVMKRADPTDY